LVACVRSITDIMKILQRRQFGNSVLRQVTHQLEPEEILSATIQDLIADMLYTLGHRKYGIGLAAPQVGRSIALSIVSIKPTPSRPNNPIRQFIVINPEIIKTYGAKTPMWEGCISFGGTKDFPYAQVPRYKKIRLRWYDEAAKLHEQDFEGITAHVLQHEVDHLQGILFVDRVEDTKSYMTVAEYRRRYVKSSRN
jgi:peptide deformylase